MSTHAWLDLVERSGQWAAAMRDGLPEDETHGLKLAAETAAMELAQSSNLLPRHIVDLVGRSGQRRRYWWARTVAALAALEANGIDLSGGLPGGLEDPVLDRISAHCQNWLDCAVATQTDATSMRVLGLGT